MGQLEPRKFFGTPDYHFSVPIERKEFEQGEDTRRDEEDLVRFLAEHPTEAFTAPELRCWQATGRTEVSRGVPEPSYSRLDDSFIHLERMLDWLYRHDQIESRIVRIKGSSPHDAADSEWRPESTVRYYSAKL